MRLSPGRNKGEGQLVSHWESGKREISERRVKQLCKIFKISEKQLEEYRNGKPAPINYKDECILMINIMDKNKLEAVYGMLVNF